MRNIFNYFAIVISFLVCVGCSNQPTVEGARESHQKYLNGMRDIFKAHASAVQDCYVKDLNKSKDTKEGTVVVECIIDDDGAVSTARIREATIKNKEAEECVLSEVKSLKFARNPNNVARTEAVYPYAFKTE